MVVKEAGDDVGADGVARQFRRDGRRQPHRVQARVHLQSDATEGVGAVEACVVCMARLVGKMRGLIESLKGCMNIACMYSRAKLLIGTKLPGSPSDLNTGNRIEGATGCPNWCRPLRPLFHFLCSNLKANPVQSVPSGYFARFY